jgi:hypothetical protein
VPAQQIAENLAYINWTVLTGLAVGSFWAAAFGRLATEATKGYLAFVAFSAAVLAALAALSDGALPAAATAGSGPIQPDAAWASLRQDGLWALALVALVAAVGFLAGRRMRLLAIAGSVVGGGVLLAGALAWGGGAVGSGLLLIELGVLGAPPPPRGGGGFSRHR